MIPTIRADTPNTMRPSATRLMAGIMLRVNETGQMSPRLGSSTSVSFKYLHLTVFFSGVFVVYVSVGNLFTSIQ